MRKVLKFLIIISFMFIIFPSSVSAITLGQYESELASYKKQLQEKNAQINKTQSEIDSANNTINSLKSEMLSITDEVKKLNEEMDNYNSQILTKLEESKQLIEYLQLSSGENAYLNYLLNAESAAELIYRRAVIKELVDYNDKAISDMQQIIDDNKVREKEIENRKVAINEKEEELNKQVVVLGQSKESLSSGAMSVTEEINNIQKIIDGYKKLGCKSNDVIGIDCAVYGSAGVFRRPTEQGYITQEYWYKEWTDSNGKLQYSMHRGLDISSSRKSKEKIYPVANGEITAIYEDGYHAKCIEISYYDAINRTYYATIYAHLSSYAPGIYVGQKVTSEQYIGYMGTTGYSTGVHLHMELFPCRYLKDSQCLTWNLYTSFAVKSYKNGFKGPRALINFPSGTYNTWYTR